MIRFGGFWWALEFYISGILTSTVQENFFIKNIFNENDKVQFQYPS